MQSLRIYVPTARVNDPAVRRGLDRVLAGGATLYAATGAWPEGTETLMERVVVVEVLDADQGRQDAVDALGAALLAAGEEAVLVARQEICTRFITRGDRVPAVAQPRRQPGLRAS